MNSLFGFMNLSGVRGENHTEGWALPNSAADLFGKREKGMDKRIRKTKKLLSQSLLSLILEKGYEKVTVQDILDRAQVGRATFYSHYENKEQLFKAWNENLEVSFFGDGQLLGTGGGGINFLGLFQHAGENQQLAKALIGSKAGDVILEHLKNNISEEIMRRYKGGFFSHRKEKLMLSYNAQSAASAVTSLLRLWLDDHQVFTPEEMSRKAGKLVEAVFK